MKSPISYLGGKSRLTSTIVPLIPKDHKCYCEPFCGASWVLFAKEPSKVEVINDRDSELITFWRVIQNHIEEFLRYYKWALVSRELFKLEQKKDPATLTDIQRAVRYFYLQKSGFGGKTYKRTFGTGTTRGPSLNLTNIEEILLETHWRLARITVENLDFLECIKRYDRKTTFFYIDPPYYDTAGYAIPFSKDNYKHLQDLLSTIKGRFILSLNDHPEVRKFYKQFTIKKVSTTYSVGRKDRDKKQGEVLIHNL